MAVPAIGRMEERNLVGVCHIDVVNVLDVVSMPDELAMNVTGDVVLADGATWKRIYLDDDGGLFTEKLRMVQGAQLSDATMSGVIAKHRLALMPNLWSLKSGRYLVRMELRNGEPLIMGRPETGAAAILESVTSGGVIGTDRNEYRVVFSLTRRLPVPFHNGTVPEPTEPVECPTLAELLAEEDWSAIEALLDGTQLSDAEASICEVPADALAQLKDSAGTNIGTSVTIPPGGPTTVTAPDGAVQVKDSAGTNIGSPVAVKSNGTANATVGDSTITKPDGTTVGLLATVALDVRNYRSGIVYHKGRILWSGQTTAYTTGDEGTLLAAGWFDDARPVYPTHYAEISSWLVLTANNIWGNTNRFTDETGAQTYTLRIIQDHLTGYEWYVPATPPTGSFTTAIAAALALTYNGYSDWKIPPLNVLQTIVDTRPAIILNYAPFSVPGQTIWSSTTNPSITSAALPVLANGSSQSTVKSSATPGYFYVRKF